MLRYDLDMKKGEGLLLAERVSPMGNGRVYVQIGWLWPLDFL